MIDPDTLHLHFARCVIVQVTATCPLACAHCIVSSSPERREELDTPALLGLIGEIAASGRTAMVVLSGGEPFLKLDRLAAALERIAELGMSAGVVTSAHWAVSKARAGEILDRLPRAALADFCISADRHHLEFMSLEPVRHALEAARDRGIASSLFVCLDSDRDDFLQTLHGALGAELMERVRVRVTPTHRSGRGARHRALAGVGEPARFEDLPDEPCHGPATPAVTPTGEVMACCGDTMSDPQNWPALRLGRTGEPGFAQHVEQADSDPLLQALRLRGPKHLARLAVDAGVLEPAGKRFDRRNICEVCRWVMSEPDAVAAVRDALSAPGCAEALQAERLLAFGEVTPEPEPAE
ncbi:radical SAM protein [Marinicauda algicola]|uniref:Radical SAM protein n=1 Tax=Marinicauda algicola TaxID=2029849 RepID=A0A4S2H4R2_9PROT|nr:radical SAM protein [Marinicauda algicola]TGY90614.1 radical SAM protein [Marinicauda algicola]